MPQRAQNIAKAKALMAAVGHANGFQTTLTTGEQKETPELAQVIAQWVSQIGVKMTKVSR